MNGLGNGYFELSIHKKEEIVNLVKQNLINAEQMKRVEGLA